MSLLSDQEKKISFYFIFTVLFFLFFDYKIANFFNQINNQTKSLFVVLTNFGDSIYYFIPLLIILLVLKITNSSNKSLKTLSDVCLFLLWNIMISGLIVQVIKHIVGRPRPILFLNSDQTSLDFFSFDSQLHSFPSGHSATVFSFAIAMLFLFPKIKNLWLLYATIIALTRVIISAHFLSDIIAGAFVSYLVANQLRKIFFNRGKLFINEGNLLKHNNEIDSFNLILQKYYLWILNIYLKFNFYWRFLTIMLLTSIVFFIFPSLDITVSGLFFLNNGVFIAAEHMWFIYLIRKIILPMGVLLTFFIPISAILKYIIYKEHLLKIPVRDWVYLLSCLLLGTGFIVNTLFKNIWGRARPNDTEIFGGDQPFTIPWLNVDFCNSNCSFVSGDVSFFTLSLAILIIIKKPSWNIYAYILILIISILRIIEGDHFLSDTLMSYFITYLIIRVLHSFFKKFPEDIYLSKFYSFFNNKKKINKY